MIKIVDGKRYNTKTAEAVASYDRGLGYGNFRQYSETLYRTSKGNWFLAGEGGPASPYFEDVGDNMRGAGSGIMVLTIEEAICWLEEHDEISALEEYFPDVIQDA